MMMTIGTTIQQETAIAFLKGSLSGFTRKRKAKPFARPGYQKPVTAHGKAVGNREADPGILDNLQIQSAMVTGNVIDAHEKHHEKTHITVKIRLSLLFCGIFFLLFRQQKNGPCP